MSSSFAKSDSSRTLGQSSPSFTKHSPSRLRQGQANSSGGAQYVNLNRHAHSGSITSNPSHFPRDPSQFAADEEVWRFDQQFDFSAAGSPGDLPQPTYLYSFDADTPHHDQALDDFLTTETSSENPLSEHTTPQELIWEQQFITQDTPQPHILDPYGVHPYSHPQAASGSDPHGIFNQHQEALPKFVSGEELRTSAFAATVPPRKPVGAQQGQSSSMASSITPPPPQKKGTSHTLKVDTTQSLSTDRARDAWPHVTPHKPVPSPVVMISSYESVDADRQDRAKRSRSSDSSDDDDDHEHNASGSDSGPAEVLSTHLMPPDASDIPSARTNSATRAGVEPSQRGEDLVFSVKDIEQHREREEKNAEVQSWLATSEAGSDAEDQPRPRRQRSPSGRTRAPTIGVHTDVLGHIYSDKHIPGPGALLDVDTDDEYFDDVSIASSQLENITDDTIDAYHRSGSPQMSPHALAAVESPEQSSFPALEDEIPPELQEPLPRQFYRRTPWQDPARGGISDERDQPGSSNAAAYKFNQEAVKWETASRAATWGTRRRLSESEVNSIVDGSQVRHLSLSKRGRERGNSILNKARGLLPRRSSSNIKTENGANEKEQAQPGHAHRSSVSTTKSSQRKPSFTKPRSPQLDTGSALMAMTGQLAAIGRTTSRIPEPDPPKTSRPLQSLRKQRSKSDVAKKSSSPGLAELMTRHGGPPIPTLASPMHERETILAAQVIDNEAVTGDDDDDDQTDEVAIRMDLEIRADEITPSVEGFKDHARKLNPRLEPYLIERIGQEQIRRYKRLVETKIKHTQSVQQNMKCASGKYCSDLGGEAVLLAPRVSPKDPEATLTQFQVSNAGETEIDESGFTEGIITPALFPTGIPLPNVSRLPAELECHLCFKVKKFFKPSDWTKHVHEDIQPFSCTFPNCMESKSFKRKADWVRHENERHRHLEWWKCSHQECSHVCYRKDNFVQHLVREHKMVEPKVKTRGSASSKNKPINNSTWQAGEQDSELSRMVDSCHFGTTHKARDEPCRFCGNVCSSWKQLSVHMGKHMEQLAMPVLELVRMRQVGPDTIISPIEQPQPVSSFGPIPVTLNNGDSSNLSPYPASAVSAYQTSSAGQSPASMHGRMHNGGFSFDQGYYSPHTMAAGPQPPMLAGNYGSSPSFHNPARMYLDGSDYLGTHNGARREHSLSPQNQLVTPRSQPVTQGFPGAFFDPMGSGFDQASLQSIYTGPDVSTGYMPPYAPSALHDLPSHSPMGMEGQSGLGLQPMNHQQRHQQHYAYGPGRAGSGQTMRYP